MSVNPFPYNQKKGEPMSKMNWKIFENRDSSIYLWLNWFLYNITHRFSIDFDIFRRTQKRNVSIALVHRFDVMLSISISHSIKTGCTAEKKMRDDRKRVNQSKFLCRRTHILADIKWIHNIIQYLAWSQCVPIWLWITKADIRRQNNAFDVAVWHSSMCVRLQIKDLSLCSVRQKKKKQTNSIR